MKLIKNMKILSNMNPKSKKDLDRLLAKRKKLKLNTSVVTNIIRDVKKNGDKAILKYVGKNLTTIKLLYLQRNKY